MLEFAATENLSGWVAIGVSLFLGLVGQVWAVSRMFSRLENKLTESSTEIKALDSRVEKLEVHASDIAKDVVDVRVAVARINNRASS